MRLQKLLCILALASSITILNADVRLPAAEVLKFATVKTPPEYGGVAKQMRITGKAEIEIVIATDGSLDSAKAVSGNPLLTGPAINAVKKWKFNPVLVQGEPVKAVTVVSFDFK